MPGKIVRRPDFAGGGITAEEKAAMDEIVQPGRYVITNNREFNPLTQQARRVAD